jgi:hypothetical protein
MAAQHGEAAMLQQARRLEAVCCKRDPPPAFTIVTGFVPGASRRFRGASLK